MTSSAAIFETIIALKRAVKRNAYDSDSDSSIDRPTNRGHKLKRKARYVRQGQLAPPTAPAAYKRKIIHAGYEREVISRNPPIVDEDGYEVDSDDDDERAQAATVAAAERDIYFQVKIQDLLAPLTSAADLPDHPTLSRPFTSKTLSKLTTEAEVTLQKERTTLAKIRNLYTKLSGDNTWIPCGSIETDHDITLFYLDDKPRSSRLSKLVEEHDDNQSRGPPAVEGTGDAPETDVLANRAEHPADPDSLMSTLVAATTTSAPDPSQALKALNDMPLKNGEEVQEQVEGIPANDGDVQNGSVGKGPEAEGDQEMLDASQTADSEAADDPNSLVPRRMQTRAQAQAASDNNSTGTRSISPDDSFVHPYFLVPESSYGDRNVGLPAPEAEETRRLLQIFIQKQEEVIRGAEKIHRSLLEADRRRMSVWKWSRAEAHVGEMSDGEDWYDKDEWQLSEDLKKGENEEDEDPATVAKKTRTRRQ